MSDLSIWIVIVGLTLVTIVTRSSFLVLGERFPLPERVQHALRYAPVCALAALLAPEVLMEGGRLTLDPLDPKLVSAIVTAVVVLTTRSMFGAMAAGMGVFAAMRLLP